MIVYPKSTFLVQGVNDASEIVNYAKLQPSFRQISQPKYLAATTTRRVYHNITKVEVEAPEIKELLRKRKVETLDGELKVILQA